MPKYTPRMVKVKTKQNKVEVKQISCGRRAIATLVHRWQRAKISRTALENCSAISTKDEHIKINNFTSK